MTMTKWLSRHSDGRHFPVYQKKKLPKLKAPVKSIPPTLKKVITIPLENLVPREAAPTNIESRAGEYIRRFKEGVPLPPIWVESLGGSRYRIWDGHARFWAARYLGIKSLQATIMSKAQLEKMRAEKIPKVLA
jgi:hypothetical protein